MEAAAVIALIIKGVQIATASAPVVMEAIPRIKADIEAAFESYTGREMTDAESTQLDSDIEALSTRLHTPLTPE